MHQKKVLILGSGHLAKQARRAFTVRGYKTTFVESRHFDEVASTPVDESTLEYARDVLEKNGVADADIISIVDREDRRTLYLLLAVLSCNEHVPIIVALSHDTLADHISSIHPNVRVCNPTAVAAPAFVDAIEHTAQGKALGAPEQVSTPETILGIAPADKIMHWLIGLFLLVFVGGAAFFRVTESVSWADAFYLIATVITSVSFSDALLHNYAIELKVARTVMLLVVYAFILLSFSLVVDYIIKRRTEALFFGRKRYTFKNHVIVCGLGRVGHHVVDMLQAKGYQAIAIEERGESRYVEAVRAKGVPVLVGDATLPKNLVDAGVTRARAVLSVMNDDLKNLEVGVSVRSLAPQVPLVLRIFDRDVAEGVRQRFGIHAALSTSAIAADTIVTLAEQSVAPSQQS